MRSLKIQRILFCFCFLLLFQMGFWCFESVKSSTKHKPEYSQETLKELQQLIKDPAYFKQSPAVSEYFSWPVPLHASSIEDTTDPKQSSYVLLPNDLVKRNDFQIGDELKIGITARNGRGERKLFGGDYFRVLLTNKGSSNAIMGSVTDHNDGTYAVKIPLPFTGKLTLRVTLIHSSEAVDLLRRITSTKHSPGLHFQGFFKDRMLEEKRDCNVWLPSLKNISSSQYSEHYCNFSSKHLEQPWICDKPRFLDCSKLQAYLVSRSDEAAAILKRSSLFEQGVNLRVEVGQSTTIIVKNRLVKKKIDFDTSLPICKSLNAGTLSPKPSGYFFEGNWKSFYCKAKNFEAPLDEIKCLKNKQLHIVGDSTIRLWYSHYVQPFSMWSYFSRGVYPAEMTKKENLWEPRKAVDNSNNIIFHFSSHGPPLQNGGSPSSQPYIADTIDEIKGGKETVLAVTIGPHMYLYDPAVYIRRLKTIKEAIKRLLVRSPDTVVVFKGMNIFMMDDFTANQCCLSDWLALRFDTIARNMFKNMKGVAYLDMWYMSGSHPSIPGGLHTQPEVVRNEVSLFLSFICPDISW